VQVKDIKDFRSGEWVQRLEYKSFSPNAIYQQWMLSDSPMQMLLSQADRAIGKLDAFSTLVPNVDFFIKMHITKEATVSSKIEGTQTSFEEALIKEEDIHPEKRDDWTEVNNYVKAINHAIAEMDTLPISNRLIRQTHAILLSGARGKEKRPGTFRTSQNWIGRSLRNAIFVPPTHEEIPNLMEDLEHFIHAEIMAQPVQVPHLIKVAMIHYQFETIHPFLDGNGRIGRLLITLYLINKGQLTYPTLYLSAYFEKNRTAYYDHLTRTRTDHQMSEWIIFFLNGVVETAQNSIMTFENIIALRDDLERNKLPTLGKKLPTAMELLTALFKNPIMDAHDVAQALGGVHFSTAARMIRDFEQRGILQELTGYKRNRIYSFEPYLRIFR